VHTTQSNVCSAVDFIYPEPCPQQPRVECIATTLRESHSSVSMSRKWERLKKSRSWLNSGSEKMRFSCFPVLTCSNAANIGECKSWTQSEFCTWQNSVTGQEPQKMYIQCTSPAWRRPNIVQSGWPPLSDVAAVTKPRRETHWNLLGNRSQPLVGQSSPYWGDMWKRYCCLTSFFPIVDTCISCEDSAGQICATVPKWRFFASFLYSVSSELRAAHFRPAF